MAAACRLPQLSSRTSFRSAAHLLSCARAAPHVLCSCAVPSSQDVWGWTPLMHAIDAHTGTSSREAVLMLLLDAGASVDVWGKDLKGPLDMMEAREEQIKQQQRVSAAPAKVQLPPPGSTPSASELGKRASTGQPRRLTTIMRQKSGTGSRRSLDAGSEGAKPTFCTGGHQCGHAVPSGCFQRQPSASGGGSSTPGTTREARTSWERHDEKGRASRESYESSMPRSTV